MIKFHAVLIDETGCEFGADVEAKDHADARDQLRERYPESRIDDVASPQDAIDRHNRRMERLLYEMDMDF